MTYETSTFSSAGDLLSKLRTFLLANGFTVHTTNGDALASPAKLYFSKGILHVAMSHTTKARSPSSPYSGYTETLIVANLLSETPVVGNLYNAQFIGANATKQGIDPTNATTEEDTRLELQNLVNGSAYFFFYSNNTLHIQISAGNGNYFPMTFSEYSKITHSNGDTYLGGTFAACGKSRYWYQSGCLNGFSAGGFLKANSDLGKSVHIYINNSIIQNTLVKAYTVGKSTYPTLQPLFDGASSAGTNSYDLAQGNGQMDYWNAPRGFAGDNPITQFSIIAWKSATEVIVLGTLPTIFGVRLTDSSGLTAESEITIGVNTYKIFPVLRRYLPLDITSAGATLNTLYNNAGGSDGRSGSSSGLLGIAVLKVL